MYTQCPDCDTATKITAPDLKRAGGRIVCGGCGREFNALEHLTEDHPSMRGQGDDAKAVLETLDELTGPHEIRIEDTGVEWCVIDEEDASDDNDVLPAAASETPLDESSSGRWYIDYAEGDTDIVLDDTASPEAAAESTLPRALADESPQPSLADPGTSGLQEPLELPSARGDEDVQRYDDNTPLPDDFIDEREPRAPQRRAEDRIEPRSPEADEAQVDLALGEPDDWMDLLDEVGQRGEGATPSAGPVDEGALADTDVRPRAEDVDVAFDDRFPSDIDTQFDLQAIELGIDLTGNRELSLEGEVDDHDEAARREAVDAAAEDPGDELTLEGREQDLPTDGLLQQDETGPAAPDGAVAVSVAPSDALDEKWFSPGGKTAAPDAEDSEDAEERRREAAFEEELAAAYSVTVDDELTQPADEPAQAEHFVPPPTEEEMTINMLIDQDLMRVAEQQDVFTSTKAHNRLDDAPHVETIIMEGEFVRNALEADLLAEKPPDSGDFGRDMQRASGEAPVRKKADAKDAPADEDVLLDTYIKSRSRVRGGRRRTDPPSYTVIAGVAALSLVLAAQVVHAYRDSLATYDMFDRTIGSLYRLLGEPLIPDWNVKEWQFEATSGSTDEMDEVLTISSRVANSSAKPLPFPLLHVSLTDRFEEIIGSKVLEPAEYLTDAADSAGRVAPGDSFTAVVRVEAPAPEATGFKLNVCYRDSGDRVRCATEDFKN